MQIERHINSGSIRQLYPVLQAWADALNQYLTYFDYDDNPWWYNERANLSCLAGAAWKVDGIALEEYRTEKGKVSDRWKGRCDLLLGTRDEIFGCEAKQVWCPVGRKAKKGVQVAKKGLKKACEDARNLTKDEGRRLGLCFVVPYLPKRDKDHVDQQIKAWLNDLRNIECCSIAWCFPEMARNLTSTTGEFYPGVVLLVKEVHRQV